MTLNPSGPMSIGGSVLGESINLELGRAADYPSNLDEPTLRNLAEVPSGIITLADFYGKSAVVTLPPPGEVELVPGDGSWTVPALVTQITICMIGGGGGGSAGDQNKGGRAGQVIHAVKPVTPGEVISVSIGVGGAGDDEDPLQGGDTAITGSFGTLVAVGGEHADNDGYNGEGAEVFNCYAATQDGVRGAEAYAGQGGFAEGGFGATETLEGGGSGTKGSGGGGGAQGTRGGNGGDGLIHIMWGTFVLKTIGEFDLTIPAGVTTVKVCMIGGGAGGETAGSDFDGGFAGDIIDQLYAVTPNEVIHATVGAGGGVEGSGEDSVFGTLIAAGATSNSYEGDSNEPRTTCYGTAYNGERSESSGSTVMPGQAGFGDGGDGSDGTEILTARHNGKYGGGGGGNAGIGSGHGGFGLIKIQWGEGIG